MKNPVYFEWASASDHALTDRLQDFQSVFFTDEARQNTSPKLQNLLFLTHQALFYFFSNRYNHLSAAHCLAPTQLRALAKTNRFELFREAQVFGVHQVLNLANGFEHCPGNLEALLNECRQIDLALTLVDKALAQQLCLPSPFSQQLAQCQESYELPEGLTALRFTDGDQCFFLLQWVSSADGLYFPLDNVLVCFAHVKAHHVNLLADKLLLEFADAVAYAQTDNRFGGVIASHGRPSHYFYDVWPSLYALRQNSGLVAALPAVIQREDQDFLDLEWFFPPPLCQVLASRVIDDWRISQRKFFVHVGAHSHLRDRASYEACDRALVATAATLAIPTIENKLARLSGCYPVVWIGVEGQKRCWLQQVEGYASILNQLAEKYPDLGIIFDGWTLPGSASKPSHREANKDNAVAAQIIGQLPGAVRHVSVIGEASLHKLAIGQAADFFICNFATGSLHVSRLLGKPGFCHLSNASAFMSLKFAMHVHPNLQVHLLPKTYVSDEAGAEEMRHDMVSYTINPAEFYGFISERLEAVLANRPPEKIRLFIEPSYCVNPNLRFFLKLATHGNLVHVPPNSLDKVYGLSPEYLLRTLVYGTFPFGGHAALPAPADYWTWLKEPVRRVCFHALQLKRMAANQGKPVTLAQVCMAGHKVLDNYLTRLLAGAMAVPYGQCDETLLAAAATNLRQFSFIGLEEHFSQSCDLLCELTGWDRTLFANLEEEPFPIDDTDLTDAERKQLAEANRFDSRLYQMAAELFAACLATSAGKVDCPEPNPVQTLVIGPSHAVRLKQVLTTGQSPDIINIKNIIGVGGLPVWSPSVAKAVANKAKDQDVFFIVGDFRFGNKVLAAPGFSPAAWPDGEYLAIEKDLINDANDRVLYQHSMATLAELATRLGNQLRLLFWDLAIREQQNRVAGRYQESGVYRHPVWNLDEVLAQFPSCAIDIRPMLQYGGRLSIDSSAHPSLPGWLYLLRHLRGDQHVDLGRLLQTYDTELKQLVAELLPQQPVLVTGDSKFSRLVAWFVQQGHFQLPDTWTVLPLAQATKTERGFVQCLYCPDLHTFAQTEAETQQALSLVIDMRKNLAVHFPQVSVLFYDNWAYEAISRRKDFFGKYLSAHDSGRTVNLEQAACPPEQRYKISDSVDFEPMLELSNTLLPTVLGMLEVLCLSTTDLDSAAIRRRYRAFVAKCFSM